MFARLAAISAALCALAAGCGGQDEPPSLRDVAAEVGCANIEEREPAMFARQTGRCEKGQDDISVNTFSSKEARDQYVDAAKMIGSGKIDQGDLWVTVSTFRDDGDDTPDVGGASEEETTGRPSVERLETALKSGTTVFADRVPDGAALCVAEVLEGSSLSDETLRAVVGGRQRAAGGEEELSALDVVTDQFTDCLLTATG